MSAKKSTTTLSELSAQLAGAVDAAARSVVAIHARRRIASSGVIWRDGVVVSASHTVRRDDEISVTLPTGESTTATVAGRDMATDLVVLRLDTATSPAAGSADAAAASVGSLVLAVGRPGRTVSASFGIISAVSENWRTSQGARVDRVLRLDLAIYDGFSGGPLIDATGAVLGVNNSALARGAPMALPGAVVDGVVDELLKRGHIRRGFVGVALHPVELSSTIVEKLGRSGNVGLVVMSVADGSPADVGGLMVGDVLVSANGKQLQRPTDFLDALWTVGDGATLELEHLRGGALQTVTVTPVDRGAAA
jgi:serine protease Do